MKIDPYDSKRHDIGTTGSRNRDPKGAAGKADRRNASFSGDAYPNAGLLINPKSSFFIEVISADSHRRALLGCRPDQIDNMVQLGAHIGVNGYPERPSLLGWPVLAEISARLSNGLDSDTAAASLLALVLYQLATNDQLSDMMGTTGSRALKFQLGRTIDNSVKITTRPVPEILATLWESEGSLVPLWAGERKAPSELLVNINDEEMGISQTLHIPSKKVRFLIRRANKEAAVFHQSARSMLVMSSTIATIRAYHLSLVGDSLGLPVSKWNWPDARNLLAGRIGWLLLQEGLLEDALSRTEKGILNVTCSSSTWRFKLNEQVAAE